MYTMKEMQEHALQELKDYFTLPYEIQVKYTPIFTPYSVKFFYITNVSEDKYRNILTGDVLRTEDGRLFTFEEILREENNK